MPTLSEYAKLDISPMEAGIFENIITADFLSNMMQFESMEGNAHLYTRENALATTTTHQVGDTWQDTEPTYTAKSVALTEVGLQSPLDRFALQTRSSVQSQEAALFAGMTKSVMRKLGQYFIQGEPEDVSTQFEGIDSLTRAETRMMAMDDGDLDGPGTNETELTLDRLDAMIDQVDDGQTKPHALVMNTTMRRKLTALSRVAGSGVVMSTIDMFGHKVNTYDGIPIILTNWITNAETYSDSDTWTNSTATSIFALKFGKEAAGYTIMHNGPVLSFDIQKLGIKENKNENLYRIVVYVAAVTWSAKQIAGLGGIDSAA
tara:strand:- start:292 stop:1245 length:954 start_codon:yes stop_codon:yes gene_type:complete